MLASVPSCGLIGIDGFDVRVEVNLANGLPKFEIVGLPDASVRESRERVHAAVRNSGFFFPGTRLTVNLAPADMKKEGPAYDLPIALGILACQGKLPAEALEDTCVFGELSLDGRVRPVRGALPMVISSLERGMKRVMFPLENLNEVRCVEGIDLLPVEHLADAVRHFTGEVPIPPATPVAYRQLLTRRSFTEDFRHVKGETAAKRALEIAAAGGHNVLTMWYDTTHKTNIRRFADADRFFVCV